MKSERGGYQMLRREQLFQKLVHDSYKPKGKLPEPTRCPKCGCNLSPRPFIAEHLHEAYKGELEFHYNKEENLLRASWSR